MAKVVSIKAESGISFKDSQENWYKFYSGIELMPEDGDDVEEVKRKAWNTVNREVEKQAMETLENLKK